jgi:hypothetical protein
LVRLRTERGKCGTCPTPASVAGWRETAGYMHTVLAGEWWDGKLHYVGRAHTSGDIGDLRERLLAIEIDKMPFLRPDRPTRRAGALEEARAAV